MNTINLTVASLRFAAMIAAVLPAEMKSGDEVKITIDKKQARLYGGNNQLIKTLPVPKKLL